jgi:hypothetical protein
MDYLAGVEGHASSLQALAQQVIESKHWEWERPSLSV